MKRLVRSLFAGYFICHIEEGQLKCLPCGDPDLGCTAIYAVAKKQEDFKAINAPTEKQSIEDLNARVENLEMKTKRKGERP